MSYKLTDNEIKKALECCAVQGHFVCNECPAFVNSKCTGTHKAVLDLINRLQAENERKKENVSRLQSVLLRFMEEISEWGNKNDIDTSNFSMIPILESEKENLAKQLKSEAYKEFAEMLHEELRIYGIKDKFNKSVFLNVVDNAKKELVGEDNESKN